MKSLLSLKKTFPLGLIIFSLIVVLLDVALCYAADPAVVGAPLATATPQASFGEIFSRMMPMFFMVFFVFYFLVIRPQQTKLKQQNLLLSALKAGDVVVTTSGIIGRVAGTEKDYILLEVSAGVKVKVIRENVTRRYEAEMATKKAA